MKHKAVCVEDGKVKTKDLKSRSLLGAIDELMETKPEKTLGELFKEFINNSSLIDEQPCCFHGVQSITEISMYTKADGKTFVFHAEGKRKP